MNRKWWSAPGLLLLFLLAQAGASWAETYTLPGGPLPGGCTASGAVVNCGVVTLDNNDVVVISAPPAVTWNIGGLKADANNIEINKNGSAVNLKIVSNGNIEIDNNVIVKADIEAVGNIQIKNNGNLTGNISGDANVTISQNAEIIGNIDAKGNVTIGNNAEITGNIYAVGDITIGSNAKITGECLETNKSVPVTQCQTTPSSLHHVRIEIGSTGLTCQREAVTFRACVDAGCTSLYAGGNIAFNLAPTNQWYAAATGGALLTNPQTIPATGWLTLYLQQPSPATVSVNATLTAGPLPSGTPKVTCNNDTSATPCNIVFSDAGLIFTADTNPGLPTTIPNQTAGDESGQLYVRAAKNDGTGHCVSAVNGGTATVGRACIDPATCLSPLTTTGTRMFDTNGYAPFKFTYNDVGRIRLTASATASNGANLAGNSNEFVVRPHHFDLSPISCSDGTANPAAANAGGSKFCKAGEDFTVTVTARSSTGTVTPNYGKETAPESVKLTHALVSGLNLTESGNLSGSFGAFNNGVASGTFQWDEVGIITLTPSIGDGNYLDAGEVSGTAISHVGRFYPHHFGVIGSVTNRSDLATPGGSFTYMDEPMRVDLIVTAYNKGENPTKNYQNGFAKLDATTLGTAFANWKCTSGTQCMGIGAVSGSDLTDRLAIDTTATNSANPGNTAWGDGASTFTLYTKLSRSGSPDGPYAAVKLGAKPLDADGVTLPPKSSTDTAHCSNLDISTGTENSLCDFSVDESLLRRKIGETQLRFGRLRLVNYYGSELLAPRVEYRTEYWDGTRWTLNTDDSLTAMVAGNIYRGTGGLTVGTVGALANGRGFITFGIAGAGHHDIAVNLNASGNDTSCNTAHGGTPANMPWLQGYWSGSCNGTAAWAQDPNARIRLGSPRAPYIYLRERY